ncbi:MAG: hypothetical protein M3462_07100, partial [Chloroflexota bacterium]|nr:hypothetical protein [Chloroflexota bacterium]
MLTLNAIIGLIVVTVLVLLGVAYFLVGMRSKRDPTYGDMTLGYLGRGIGPAVVILTLAVAAFMFFPYDLDYHSYQNRSGTVQGVSSRFNAANGGTSQKFVVRFEGEEEEFGCLDTRCSLIEVGDVLSLACVKNWD